MAKTKARIAYGYVRVSTDEQVSEGISLRTQRARIRAYAKAHGWELRRIFADEGVSGRSMDRPGLQRLLERVRGKQGEAVIVYRLSRLSRSTRDLLTLSEDTFAEGNTHLVSITEHIDTETVLGKFFLTIMGALAQMERELIAERTRATLQFKREQGELLGSVPFGYRESLRVPDKLVQDRSEMAVVRRIARMRKEGVSFAKIAAALNEDGVPTKRGRKWYASTVSAISKHPMHEKLFEKKGI